MNHRKSIFALTLLIFLNGSLHSAKPRMSIVFVIDQFAYHYIYKLKPFLTGGLKFLLDNGVVFENAHYPHAMPETAVGHTALNTGTLAKDHGIIADAWFDPVSGKLIEADDNDPEKTAVFSKKDDLHPYGKGPNLIMVDGLSDQFAMLSEPNNQHVTYSLSIKSRAAIPMANKLGKAVWFDKQTGNFTSSKAYFEKLPTWVSNFNTVKKIDKLSSVTWTLTYPDNSPAYKFNEINNYSCTKSKKSRIGVPRSIIHDADKKEPFSPIYLSPLGNQLLLELAQECIKTQFTQDKTMLLWISISDLDLVGHRYGPDSLEAIDMIYHIDKQLQKFMNYVNKKMGKSNVLFALTADHGVVPMQCVLFDEGIKSAHKLVPAEFITEMNELINKNHHLEKFITNFQMPAFYYDQTMLAELDEQTRTAINKDLKAFLMGKTGVKNVWTYTELDTTPFDPKSQELELNFRNQKYPGRSGELFLQLQPYSLLTSYPKGTTHESPYNYDTHVPLIFYHKGKLENKKVTQRVYMTQFANTMAQIMHVPKPSASTASLLPGIFENIIEVNAQKTQSSPQKS